MLRIGPNDYEAISVDGRIDANETVETIALATGTLKVRRLAPK